MATFGAGLSRSRTPWASTSGARCPTAFWQKPALGTKLCLQC